MNKFELIEAVAKSADISKAAAGRALEGTVTAIKTSLKKGGMVTLVGFGTFYVGKRAARSGRNPRTGATIKIKAAKVPKFRAGKGTQEAVKGALRWTRTRQFLTFRVRTTGLGEFRGAAGASSV